MLFAKCNYGLLCSDYCTTGGVLWFIVLQKNERNALSSYCSLKNSYRCWLQGLDVCSLVAVFWDFRTGRIVLVFPNWQNDLELI